MFAVKKNKKVKYTFNIFISYSVKRRSQPQTRHTQHFKDHSVNSCAYLAFLSFLISQRAMLSRNKKLMGCCLYRALFCAQWTLTCQTIGEYSYWNGKAQTGSTARQIPFWKQLGYFPKRDSYTLRALEASVSNTGVFSLSYSSMEINRVTLNMTKLSWWDAFSAPFNAHKEKFCKAMLIIRWNCRVWVNISM